MDLVLLPGINRPEVGDALADGAVLARALERDEQGRVGAGQVGAHVILVGEAVMDGGRTGHGRITSAAPGGCREGVLRQFDHGPLLIGRVSDGRDTRVSLPSMVMDYPGPVQGAFARLLPALLCGQRPQRRRRLGPPHFLSSWALPSRCRRCRRVRPVDGRGIQPKGAAWAMRVASTWVSEAGLALNSARSSVSRRRYSTRASAPRPCVASSVMSARWLCSR